MHYLTKRQQQVLRRMLFGDARWNLDFAGQHWDVGGWVLPFTAADEEDLPYTTTSTLNALDDAGLVGQYLDPAETVHYALTVQGRVVASVLVRNPGQLYSAAMEYVTATALIDLEQI